MYAAVQQHPSASFGRLRIISNQVVVWPSGSAEPTIRTFQDSEFVVLVFVAKLTGGTETFYLNTKTMRFTLVEATLPAATETGFKPKVTQGILRRK